jgi:hypothetical protein
MQFITDNLGNIALFGGLGSVVGFLVFAIYAKFSASVSDDEWVAKVGAVVAYAVKLTPTTSDDELLAKVNEFAAGLLKK